MLKDLLKEGGLYTLANFLTKGISLLLIPFYTAYFTPSDYGVIDMLTLFGLFAVNIFNFQLNQGLARYVAEPTFNPEEKITYASTAIWSSIFLFFIGFGVLYLFEYEMINLLSSEYRISRKTYYLAIVAIFLNGVFYMLGIHLRTLRKSKEYSLVSLIHALLSIVFVLVMVIKFDLGVNSVYLSFVILVPFLIMIEFYLLKGHLKFVFNISSFKKLFYFSLPLVPASISVVLMNFSDRIYIKEYLDFSELGVYAMGTKFATIIGLIVGGFSMAITPIIVQNQYKENSKTELSKIFSLFISLGTIGVLVLSLFSKEIVELFTNVRFHQAGDVMPLMFLTVYVVGFGMFAPGLMLKKKTVISASLVMVFAGVNIALNIFLIPKYSLYGAALATLISTLGYQIISFLISQRYYEFKYDLNKIGFVSVLHIVLISGVVFINPEISVINISFKLLLLVLYVWFLIWIDLLDYKKIMSFINKKKI